MEKSIAQTAIRKIVNWPKNFLPKQNYGTESNFRPAMPKKFLKKPPANSISSINDVDKGQYPEIFELVWRRVRKGGFYICDNTLWSSRVIEEKVVDDVKPGWTEAIKKHNEMVFNHPEFETHINPIRDGVIIARRKNG